MIRTLKDIEKRFMTDGIIYNITPGKNNEKLIINKRCFVRDTVSLKHDLYYIEVAVENNKYVMKTHFCNKDFLGLYNNQQDYIQQVVDSMNKESDVQENVFKDIFNEEAIGKLIIENVLKEHIKDSDNILFWIAESIENNKQNISDVYTKEDIKNIFKELFYNNTQDINDFIEYIKYLLGASSDCDEKINKLAENTVISKTKNIAKSDCYWNEYIGKFMPLGMLKEALYELSCSCHFPNVRINNDYGQYIEITLNNREVVRVLTEEHDYADSWYSIYTKDKNSKYTKFEQASTIEELLEELFKLEL